MCLFCFVFVFVLFVCLFFGGFFVGGWGGGVGGGGQHVKPYIMHWFYNNKGIGVLLNQAPANYIFCWKRQIYQRIAFYLVSPFIVRMGSFRMRQNIVHYGVPKRIRTFIHTCRRADLCMYVYNYFHTAILFIQYYVLWKLLLRLYSMITEYFRYQIYQMV